MGRIKIHVVEILYIGDLPKEVRNSPLWIKRYFKVKLPSLAISELTIPINDHQKLILETKSPTGELIRINQALLEGNHLLASNITLDKDKLTQSSELEAKKQPIPKSLPPVLDLNLKKEEISKGFEEQITHQLKQQTKPNQTAPVSVQEIGSDATKKIKFSRKTSKRKIPNGIYKGSIMLYDHKSLKEKADLVASLWDRHDKIIEDKNKDFVQLEEQYNNKLENQRKLFETVVAKLQDTIEEQNKERIVDSLLQGDRLNKTIRNTILQSMIQSDGNSDTLKEELEKILEK